MAPHGFMSMPNADNLFRKSQMVLASGIFSGYWRKCLKEMRSYSSFSVASSVRPYSFCMNSVLIMVTSSTFGLPPLAVSLRKSDDTMGVQGVPVHKRINPGKNVGAADLFIRFGKAEIS